MLKKLFIILIVLFTITGCASDIKEPKQEQAFMLEYIMWENKEGSFFREFVNTSDEYPNLFMNQITNQINDTTWDIEMNLLRPDSIIITKFIERYKTDNSIKLLKHCFYELDYSNSPVEVNALINSGSFFPLKIQSYSFDLTYKFITDTSLIMDIHSNISYQIRDLDSLGINCSECLVYKSNDEIKLKYKDERQVSTANLESIRIWIKKKGLILFGQQNGTETIIYKLVE